MSFAAPLWLVLGAAVLVVIALHTLRRTRIEVPSVILWRRLTHMGRARRTIRPPRPSLLLLLQILIVLLLAAALAQPLLGWGSRQAVHTVLALDASASMGTGDAEEGATRFDAALAALRQRLDATGVELGDRVSLLVTGAETRLLAARQERSASVRQLADGLEVTDGTADWQAAGRLLGGIVRDDEQTRLFVFTDDAEAGTLAGAEIVAVGSEAPANAGVRARLVAGEDEEDSPRIEGAVTLVGDASAETVSLLFQPEGGTAFLDWGRIELDEPEETADGTRRAEFSEALELPSDGTLLVSLAADMAPFDDVFALRVRTTPDRARVLYIGAGNAPLELALAANPAVELFATRALPADAGEYDLVVADNVVLPETPATNMLWVGSARPEGIAAPTVAAGLQPADWDGEHPLSQGVEWQFLDAVTAYRFTPLDGAAAVLGTPDTAMIAARTLPQGREIRLALELPDADWVAAPQLPVFVGNIIEWIGFDPAPGLAGSCEVGRPCAIPAGDIAEPVRNAADEIVWQANAPEGAVLLDAVTESFVPRKAGIYRIGDRVLAVNAPAGETVIPRVAAEARETVASAAGMPLWWWVLLVAAVLLVLEMVLAGRGGEKFLRPQALARGVPGARQRRWALGLRLAGIVVAVAALTGLPLPRPDRAEDVVLVSGTAPGAERATVLAQAAGQSCALPWQQGVGVVAVDTAMVAADLPCARPQAEAWGEGGAAGNLGQALSLAAAMVRPEARGRIVVVGDGGESGIAEALPWLAGRGVRVDVQAAPPAAGADALVADVELPRRVFAGDSFPLTAIAHASAAGDAEVQILADGEVLTQETVALAAGANRIDAVVPEAEEGPHVYEVAVTAAGDAEPRNDRFAVTHEVLAPPRVAIVTPQEDWGQYFADALAVQGIETEILRPDRAPFRLDRWLDYAGVVLMNVPAIDLDTIQQEQLEAMVRVHGRGLVILGGENSFGPGGYFQTPLEDVSPLSARVPEDMPVAALAFVLDRSGSMQAQVEGTSRLDIAKEATMSAIGLLNEDSQVAVVVFDSEAHVLVPMQERKDEAAVAAALERLDPGGGTAIAPGLAAGLDEMARADSPIKHIVVMSDGLSQPGNLEELVARAEEMGVTVSAVAIGSGADVGKLSALARAGGGAFHETRDFRALPSILSQEAMMLAGEAMVRGARNVYWLDRAPAFLAGLPDPMPAIEAYVETTAKPTADLHLATRNDEGEVMPLLASWRYGNGDVLAFASHGAGPGTARWLQLPDYPLLWGQVLRQFAPATTNAGLSLTLARSGDTIAVRADALDPAGEPLSGLVPVAEVSRDGGAVRELALRETAPGRYEARFSADAPGSYGVTASIANPEDEDETLSASALLEVSYLAGLDPTRADAGRLAALAAATGGRVMAPGEPLPVSETRWGMAPAWRPWAVLVLLLLLADLTVRYAPEFVPFLRDRRANPPAGAWKNESLA